MTEFPPKIKELMEKVDSKDKEVAIEAQIELAKLIEWPLYTQSLIITKKKNENVN